MANLPALSISDLKFRYASDPSGAWVLDIPHLELQRGEQILLTGGSGRGKSTLLHLICGLMDPADGMIRVNGELIHSMSSAKRDRFRGRSIGMIFQNFNLLHGFTAVENVMVAMMFSEIPAAEHHSRAEALLRGLGIDEPHRAPDRMSIGQQQRVAVARAVACDPVLVLADEPTASLDPENGVIAMELIQNTCKERNAALLCVSHDPAMVDRFEVHRALGELVNSQHVNNQQVNS